MNSDSYLFTVDFAVMIGRYFETPQDFINMMKVNKKFKDLVTIYRYNPISNPDLFVNIQTQHFYELDDLEKYSVKGKTIYTFWKYDDKQDKLLHRLNSCEFYDIKRNYTIDDDKVKNFDGVDIMNIYKLKKEFFKYSKIIDINIISANKISKNCFESSPLERITLPKMLAKLGKGCFMNCKKLREIQLPRTLREIPEKCFERSGLKTISFRTGIQSIGKRAFAKTTMRSVYMPYDIKSIAEDAFEGSNINEVYCTKCVAKQLKKCKFEKRPKINVYKNFFK